MDARRAYENFEIEQAESDLQRAIRIIDQFDMRTPRLRMSSFSGDCRLCEA